MPFDLDEVSNSLFGFSTHFGQPAWGGWTPEIMPLIEQAGAKNIRDELYWAIVEPEPGRCEFPLSYDTHMNELDETGINAFIIFSYINQHL